MEIAESIILQQENDIKSFYEKVVPIASAIRDNSKEIAEKYAIDYVMTDNPISKAESKKWILRESKFKNLIEEFRKDSLFPSDIKD